LSDIDDFNQTLKSSFTPVPSKDEAEALASIKLITNKIRPKTFDGKDINAIWPTEGSKATLFTPNWCDRTTWHYKSVRVVDEVLDPQVIGVFTTYDFLHQNVIDTYHGKISGEDYLKDSDGNSYRVVVKVNGVIKIERNPHFGTGGDYTIDYPLGTVTFTLPLSENDEVKVTYHYENGSEWTIKPDSGKILKIGKVEVQFSEDVNLTDSVVFQLYGVVDIWDPQLVPNIYPSGTMIPIGDADVLKTIQDYINEANGSFPTIPIIGGNSWRGLSQKIQVFQWDYQSLTDISSKLRLEIRIKLEHDTPFNGTTATATFYCLSEKE
jgi:hypothetical protein